MNKLAICLWIPPIGYWNHWYIHHYHCMIWSTRSFELDFFVLCVLSFFMASLSLRVWDNFLALLRIQHVLWIVCCTFFLFNFDNDNIYCIIFLAFHSSLVIRVEMPCWCHTAMPCHWLLFVPIFYPLLVKECIA